VNRNCLKIRLYPDRAQARELKTTLETCRLVYNSLINDRKFQYDTAEVSVGYFTQKAYLPAWKKDHPELKESCKMSRTEFTLPSTLSLTA